MGKLFPIVMVMAAGALAGDFKVGQCAMVKPSARSLESPRGDFFIGGIGQVTEFIVWENSTSLNKTRVAVVLHFPVEPKDWEGFGQGFLPKDIRAIPCPYGFSLKPYGFDPKVILGGLELLNKILEASK